MPKNLRSGLVHLPEDYAMEASIDGTYDDKVISAIWDEITAIVRPYGGDCWECGPILPDYVPFEDHLTQRYREN